MTDYKKIVEEMRGNDLRETMAVATRREPDAEAKLLDLSKRTGIPVEAIRLRTPEAEYQARLRETDADRLMRESPQLANWLTDPGNASLSHDDTGPLSSLERAVGAIRAMPADITSAGFGLGELAARNAESFIEWGAGDQPHVNPFTGYADLFETVRKGQAATADRYAGDLSGAGLLERGILGGIRSFAQMLPGMAASIFTGNPAPMLAMAGGMSGSTAGTAALDKGMAPWRAALVGGTEAAIEISTEMIPAMRFIGSIKAGDPFVKLLAKQMAVEIPGEMMATLGQSFNAWANGLNGDQTFEEYVATLPEAEAETIIATVTMTALSAGAGRGASMVMDRAQSKQQRDKLKGIIDAADKTKLRKRSPDALHGLMGQMTGNATVYVDAQVLAQSARQMAPEEFERALPGVAKELAAAIPGDMIEIPVATIATYTAGTPLEEVILQNFTVSPMGTSLADAAAAGEQAGEMVREDATRIAQEAEAEDARLASRDVVKQKIKAEIIATGKRSPDAAEAEADIIARAYDTLSQAEGMTAEELYAGNRLHSQPGQAGATVQAGKVAYAIDDARLHHDDFRAALNTMTASLMRAKDGNMALVVDPNFRRGESDRGEDVPMIRSSSVNPSWFQALAAAENVSVEYVRETIRRLTAGEKLGKKQMRVAEAVMEEATLQEIDWLVDRAYDVGISYDDVLSIRDESTGDADYAIRLEEAIAARQDARAGAGTAQDAEATGRGESGDSEAEGSGDVESLADDYLAAESDYLDAVFTGSQEGSEENPFGGGGLLSQPARIKTDTPEFKAWFGEWDHPKRHTSRAIGPSSYAVDNDGNPLVLYHATNSDFNAFAVGRSTINSTTFGDIETSRQAIFASPDAKFAEGYLKDGAGQNVMPVYMSIQSPMDMREGLDGQHIRDIVENADGKIVDRDFYYLNSDETWSLFDGEFGKNFVEAATKAGYDGAIITESSPEDGNSRDVYVAFRPTQIKSVFNRGTFDPTDANILRQSGAEERDLIITHNLSAENLLHSQRMGGIPVPSLAVTKKGEPLSGFGEITLIGPVEMADPKGYAGTKVFGADIYSPRYPQLSYKLDKAALTKLNAALKPHMAGREIYGGEIARIDDLTQIDAFREYAKAQLGADTDYHAMRRLGEKLLREVGAEEKIFQGFTNSGNRKYIDHTLENVVRLLKQELRGGEGSNFEVGSIRSKFTPQFKSVAQIRKEKGRLVSKEEFEKVKEEIDRDFWALADSLKASHAYGDKFGFGDILIDTLKDSAKMGLPRALKENQFAGVPDEVMQEAAQFLTRLKNLPTQYFEAKILRDVDLAEFAGAVIPDNASQDVRDALASRGIKNVATYKAGDEADRVRAVGELSDQMGESVLFQDTNRAGFNPETFAFSLTDKSDLSSVHHESAHAFLEIMARLASRPEASPRVKEMMGQFLAWRGIDSLETWNAMTLEQKRPHHEAWAEGWEQYLLEGKAPTPELQPLMRRFRAWMKQVYGSLLKFLKAHNPELTAEIRQVYDRIIATDEAIAAAEGRAGLTPDEIATAEAVEQLQAKSMRNLKWAAEAKAKFIRAEQRKVKAARAAVIEEVKAEVAATPVEQIRKAIREAKKAGTPLGPGELMALADAYQFDGPEAMQAALDSTPKANEQVKALAEQRMLERHGEMLDPADIEKAADEAVHNEARARALAAELTAQDKATGRREDTGRRNVRGARITVNAMVEAAKQFAANLVAEKKVIELKRATQMHIAAEAKAAKKWAESTKKGDTTEAIQAKRSQAIHHAAARALLEAQAETDKMAAYLKRFDKDTIRAKVSIDYLQQIDQLLERVDLRKSVTGKEIARRASLMEWVQQQQDMWIDPEIPDYLIQNARLTSYKEMTVEELRGLVDAVKNIEHIGRLKNKLLTDKKNREFTATVEALSESIRAKATETITLPDETRHGFIPWVVGFWSNHRKLTSLFRQMDGNADDGLLWDVLGRGMQERGTDEEVRLALATQELARIMEPVRNMKGGFSGAKMTAGGVTLSRGGRLAVALNFGNEQNRQRLMDGNQIGPEQAHEIMATLSAEELRFVNAVWEYIDSFWPEVKAKQERITGLSEEKVEATPFKVIAADGTEVDMRGGYFPLKYDPDKSSRAESFEAAKVADEMKRGAFTRATTRRSHTKARVEKVKRAIRLDLDVIPQHVNEVVHDLVWHEWLIDANRLMSAEDVTDAIRDHYGPEVLRVIKDTLSGIATADIVPQDEVDRGLRLLRKNVSRSVMGVSATTAFLQPFGLAQSMVRIGYKPVLRGVARWAGEASRMESTMGWIGEKSHFMRTRAQTMNREIYEISARLRGKSKVSEVADAALFFLMRKMQLVADVPTWIGMYEKTLAEIDDEAEAIARADRAVLDSQGGGQIKDMSPVQRKHPMLTMFYSYFNTTLNLSIEQTAQTDFRNPKAVAGWLADMALLWVLPALGPGLILAALRGDDDEPEDWAKKLAEWQLSYLFGAVVGVREFSGAFSGYEYAGPPTGRVVSDLYRLGQQVGQGDVDEAAVMALVKTMGSAFGIPTTQAIRSYRGWQAWDEGEAPITAILMGPPPKD